MPNLRVIFSGLCAFLTREPLEEAESLVLILPEVSKDDLAFDEVIPSHTASVVVRMKDLSQKGSSKGDLAFAHPKSSGDMKNLYLIRGNEVRFETDACGLEGLDIELTDSNTSFAQIARLRAKVKSGVFPDSFEKPTVFETTIVAARSVLSNGYIKVRELTLKPGRKKEPWYWTLGHPDRATKEYPYSREYELHRQLATSVEWVVPIKERCRIHLKNYNKISDNRAITLDSDGGKDVIVELSNRELGVTLGVPLKEEPVARDIDFYGFYKILQEDYGSDEKLVIPIAKPENGAGGVETGKPCVQGLIELEPDEVAF